MLPQICIISYISFTVTVFLISSLKIIVIASTVLFVLMVMLPYRKLKTGIMPITIFLVVTFVSNALFNTGRIVFNIGSFVITEEGLYIASIRTLRVFLLIAGAKFLSIIVSPEEMISALGSILSPLERAGLPIKSFFHTMSLSIKALPLIKNKLSNEYEKRITLIERRSLREKASVVFQFLLPVFFESVNNPESILKNEKEQPLQSEEGE